MRHVSRTHRVNPPRLHDVVQTGGNVSIKYANTKQQFADIFRKGFTNAGMCKVLRSAIGVFDMNHEKNAKIGTCNSRVSMTHRDARIAMGMQQTADEESGAQPLDTPQRDVSVREL